MAKNEKLARYTPHDGIDADKSWEIRCPYCGEDSDPSEQEVHDLITYHGDGDRVEYTCPDCEQIFYVQECVHRSYTAYKAES